MTVQDNNHNDWIIMIIYLFIYLLLKKQYAMQKIKQM